MGYELHIEKVKGLSKAELDILISNDSDLTWSEQGDTILWTAHPLGGIEGQNPWFSFHNGIISTKKPDEFVSLKLFKMAEALGARLNDDEAICDDYWRNELIVTTQKILERESRKNQNPWWKFW